MLKRRERVMHSRLALVMNAPRRWNMNKSFIVSTAIGLILSTAAVAQTPSGSSSSSTNTEPSATTTPARRSSTTTQQPAAQPAPRATTPSNGTSAQSTPPASTTTTTQSQAPAARGTTQSQSPQSTNPSAAQSAPTTQQPATNQAQTPAPSNQPATNSAQSPAPTSPPATNNAQAPSSNTSVNATANIAPQEQTRISQSIARLNVQPLSNVNFSVSVGTVIPRNVRLQTLPPDIVQFVPRYRGYNFAVVRDEIVIVEPSSSRIVAVLPRSGKRMATAPAPAQAKARFSDNERTVIRQHTRSNREPRTVGSSTRAQMRVGDRVPDQIQIREFPETVYREVPTVREYRYIDMDDRSYLVEPRRRTIIEEID
jgi:hypothetical protein